MKFNLFEGSRRIAHVIAAIGIILSLFAIYGIESHGTLKYQIATFGATPVKSEFCGNNGRVEESLFTTGNGNKYTLTLCFSASEPEPGVIVIPYKRSDNMVLMGDMFDPDVRTYTQKTLTSFRVPTEDIRSIDDHALWEKVITVLKGLGYMLLGLVGYWTFVCIIGWIVRGFLGIPNGQDFKPAES